MVHGFGLFLVKVLFLCGLVFLLELICLVGENEDSVV